MNGPMLNSNQKYQNSLKNMSSPVYFSQLPKVKMDLKGLSQYAKNKGVTVAELTEEEKCEFRLMGTGFPLQGESAFSG